MWLIKASLRNPYMVATIVFMILILGVLSALPIVYVGNACCCLWVVSGGLVAAYGFNEGSGVQVTGPPS